MSHSTKPSRPVISHHDSTDLPEGARYLTAEELDAFGPRLITDEGMAAFLTATFGTAGWAYDQDADRWIVPDRTHEGEGRGFLVVRRGGDWVKVVLPVRVLQ